MIKWNEYTWYSKWLSLIFFILVLPVLTFYIGIQYEKANYFSDPLNINTTIQQESSTTFSVLRNKESGTREIILDTLKEIGIEYPTAYLFPPSHPYPSLQNPIYSYNNSYYSAAMVSLVNQDTAASEENFIVTEDEAGLEIKKNLIIEFNPTEKIRKILIDNGFNYDYKYSGDGGLNSSSGYRKDSTICIIGQFLAPNDPGHDYNYYEFTCFVEK